MPVAGRTRRRWFQFSTLALLMAIAVIAILCRVAQRNVLNEQTSVQFDRQPLSDVLIYLSIKPITDATSTRRPWITRASIRGRS
jgi:hypothetical protein